MNLTNVDLSPILVVLGFLLAFALSFLWATVYRTTYRGIAYTRSFFITLILLSPAVAIAVAMVMMAIGSEVALSLGLVG